MQLPAVVSFPGSNVVGLSILAYRWLRIRRSNYKKERTETPMKTYRFAISMTVILLSTFVTVQAAAAQSRAVGMNASARNGRVGVIPPNLVLGKNSRLNNPTSRLSRRARVKLANLVSRGCGCATQDADALGGCWRNCLSSWGISATTILACGGLCVGAGTGNPVGIALCAACLGTGELIVAGCAMYCAWGSGGGGHGILQQDPQAKLRHRSTNPTRTS